MSKTITITFGDEIIETLQAIKERITHLATQDDINTLKTEVDQIGTDLQTGMDTVQQKLNDLAAANPSLDLSALQTELDNLDTHVKKVGELAPQAQQPPPAPTDGPTISQV